MGKYLKYFLFSLLVVVFVFAGMEALLRVFPLFRSPRFFQESRDAQGRVWAQYRTGNKPRFLKEKKPDTFRIMAFGESTTLGYPYQPRTSFPAMLLEALQQSAPEKQIEMLNLGTSAMNTLEIYYCLREALEYHPDLVIIYAGQNEFFQVSLFADWRHPKLDRTLDMLRLHSRIYQALKNADQLLNLVPAAFGTFQELTEELNLNLEELPMENRPMSRDYYQARIQSYRYHLEKILALLQQQKVPTVICTVAVNLKDWPPEWMPFPPQLSASQTDLLKNQLYQAHLDIADGQLQAAGELLEKSRGLAPDYGMYYFVKAWLEEKQGELQSSRKDFLLARKFDNNRHRAPPEINPIIRELATRYRTALVDVENLFFQNALSTPGFDLFVDHVHPNLQGQRLIAQELYQTLVHNQLVMASKPLADFPSLNELQKQLQLDQNFIDAANLHMAIYYLLQRRLPERESQTISFLNQNIAHHPEKVLASVCLASILLEQNKLQEAMPVLETAFRKNNLEQIAKALQRYFFPKIVLQGNFLLVRLNLDPALPPLRGILLVRSEPAHTSDKSILPFEQYNWIFQYHPRENMFENITDSFQENYQAKKALCSRPQKAKYDIMPFYQQKPGIFLINDASLKAGKASLEMQMTGKDPWFAFPLRLDPFATPNIELQLALTPDDPKIHQAELNLYWSSTETPEFSETQKISLPVRADGKSQTLKINLAGNINWLEAKEIFALRLDPADFKGRAQIREFKITLCEL